MKNNKEEIKKAILLCKQLNNTFSDLIANNKSLQEIEKKVNLVVMNSNIKSYEEQVSGQTFITIQNSMSYIDDSLLNRVYQPKLETLYIITDSFDGYKGKTLLNKNVELKVRKPNNEQRQINFKPNFFF